MREIKFRAWIPDIKRMREVLSMELYECDDLISNPPNVRVWDHGSTRAAKIKGRVATYKKDEVILMQFTGLKDKNGKEIYEGDILMSDDNEEPFLAVEFSQVEIGKDSWGMSHTALCWNVGYRDLSERPPIIEGKYGDEMYGQYNTELSVVGNIYENPELLN